MQDHDLIDINETQHALLKGYKEKTGIGERTLLKNTKHERPDGLNSLTVTRWLNKKIKKARRDHYEYIICKWHSLMRMGKA